MRPESTSESFSFDNAVTWLYENRVRVAVIAALVGATIVVTFFLKWKKEQTEADANIALFEIPALLGSHAEDTEKAQAEDFQKIASEFPKTTPGQHASLLAAGVLFNDGKYAEAEKQFSQYLTEHSGSALEPQAALGVAASIEAQNKPNEAIAKYQQLVGKYKNAPHAVSPAKLTLARLLEGQEKPEEALKLYDELARSNNPYDPWSAEARDRREQLLEKFPKLKSQPVPALTNDVPANVSPAPTPGATNLPVTE